MSNGVDLLPCVATRIVHAARIVDVQALPFSDTVPPAYRLFFANDQTLDIPFKWFQQNMPVPGGYFLIYNSGASGYNPASVFEPMYTAQPGGTPMHIDAMPTMRK